MKEFYMTVSPDCALYRDFFAWVEDCKKIIDVYERMQKKYGIETNNFYPYKDRFAIIPTAADKEKFKSFFLKDGTSFRKGCEMSKVWASEVKDIKFMRKPHPGFYWSEFVGSASSRLFAVGNILYCSMKTEYEFRYAPTWGNEIKASEFYKVMEEQEG